MNAESSITGMRVVNPTASPDLYLVDYRSDTETRRGVPCVFRTGQISDNKNYNSCDFTRAWQFFAVDLLAMSKYGLLLSSLGGSWRSDIVQAFNALYASNKFLTNDKGVNNMNNYITGDTNRGEDPKINPLICGGDANGKPVRVLMTQLNTKNQLMAKISAFSLSDTPPPVTMALLRDDPRVCRATNINGHGLLDNFPQLGEGFPVYYPLISSRSDESFYPMSGLYKL